MKAIIVAAILLAFTVGSLIVYAAEKTIESDTKSTKEQVIYTCSMHPEIKESKPGKCSICSMDLVPVAFKKYPQTTCPVTGKEIDKKFFTDYEGKRIYFFSGKCLAGFKKSPVKYVMKLADEEVTLENSPERQTMCPVMNEKINKKFYDDYKGKRIYFGCGACREMFKIYPGKYMKILKEQGVMLEDAPK